MKKTIIILSCIILLFTGIFVYYQKSVKKKGEQEIPVDAGTSENANLYTEAFSDESESSESETVSQTITSETSSQTQTVSAAAPSSSSLETASKEESAEKKNIKTTSAPSENKATAKPSASEKTKTTTKKTTASQKTTTVSKSSNGVKSPTYINGILIVNKTYALPSDYNPGVSPEAQRALDEMIAAAKKEGISLWVTSGFRSYTYQQGLYQRYVDRDGKAAADTYSARAGHSEHQTGLAFDMNSFDRDISKNPELQWLAKNCWKYGFIIRYPKGKEAITGYTYEPWHIRYLGKSTAKAVFDSGLCLEEYLNITSKYSN